MPPPSLGSLCRRFHHANEFLSEERDLARAIDEGLEKQAYRKFRHLVRRRALSNASTLCVTNPHGRILWVRAFAEQVLPFFGLTSDDDVATRPVFFVTLISDKYAVSHMDEPPHPLRMTSWARQMLDGFNCIGMVEPAYYTEHRREIGAPKAQLISWHAHALVWGSNVNEKLPIRIDELNESLASVTASDPAHARSCPTTEDLTRRLFYLLKSPRKHYRVAAKTLQQHKGPLRPTEHLRLLDHMGDMYLEQLAFAGGEGRALLAAIKKQAMARA